MSKQREACIFCLSSADADSMAKYHRVKAFACPNCGNYAIHEIHRSQLATFRKDAPWKLDRTAGLLFERRVHRRGAPIIYLSDEEVPEDTGYVPVAFNDLLAHWPRTPSEGIDRALAILCRLSRTPGDEIKFQPPEINRFLLLSSYQAEQAFYFKSLQELKFVNANAYRDYGVQDGHCLSVTSRGWERFREIQRTGDRTNPVFVAMWFGGGAVETQERMTRFFNESIRPVCFRLGWLAERVDSAEHNESIMDRIVALIRQAPFMIADLSDENRGVYYEAGFARGVGKEVVYLVHESKAHTVHFDLSGVNHVRWSNEDELRKKLENRILGTMGRGPHKFDGQ